MNNYPVDLDDCTKIGLWGGCGLGCSVYQEGRCEYHVDMIKRLETEDDVLNHTELYGNKI